VKKEKKKDDDKKEKSEEKTQETTKIIDKDDEGETKDSEEKKKKQKVEESDNKVKVWLTIHDESKDPHVLNLSILEKTLEDQDSHICILNGEGSILYINKAWKKFSADNGGNVDHFYKGWKYLDVMHKLHVSNITQALDSTDQFASGIQRILDGHTTEEYHLEYPCDSPTLKRIFLASAHTLNINGKIYTIISHKKLAEEDKNL